MKSKEDKTSHFSQSNIECEKTKKTTNIQREQRIFAEHETWTYRARGALNVNSL